jgi:ABC-type transporter Mla subunit MlaD
VTDADLQREFQLALQIRDTTATANQAVLLVRGIRPQIQDRAGKLDSKTGPTAKALDALEKTLTAVETQVYQVKNQSFEDPLNFPIMLNNKIASLQGIVESADAQPTDQTYDMFKLLSSRLDEQMNKLDTAVQKDLPQVNQMLQRQKLMPIKPVPLKPEEKPKPKSDR